MFLDHLCPAFNFGRLLNDSEITVNIPERRQNADGPPVNIRKNGGAKDELYRIKRNSSFIERSATINNSLSALKRNNSLADSDLKFQGLSDQLNGIRKEMATLKSEVAIKKNSIQEKPENRLGKTSKQIKNFV